MTDSVDPKKVLKIINSMGYKNVSVDQLKSFTKGLFLQLTFGNCIQLKMKISIEYFRFEEADQI